MPDHVYKKLELTGSSSKSSDDAVRNAIAKAGKTMRNMHWFEVVDTRGHIDKNKVAHWQVTIKVGFTLEECPWTSATPRTIGSRSSAIPTASSRS